MQQRRINYLLARSKAGADTFPIEAILEKYYGSSELRRRGDQIWFPCPFCGSPDLDKCSATPRKRQFRCFGCGEGGGVIKLLSQLKGISYTDAQLEIGVMSGALSYEEYEEVTGDKDSRRKFASDEAVRRRIEEKKAEEEVEQKAPITRVDLVYRHLLALPQFALGNTAHTYLLGRKLSENEIEEVGFFSYKEFFRIRDLLTSIQKEEPSFTYNGLLGVPGFYFEYKDSSKTQGYWRFIPPMKGCLGIPIRNGSGLITALQMRWLGDKIDNKYFYVSSRKYLGGETTSFGSSSGSPVCVCYPEKVLGQTFYVTEGFFKAREIAKSGCVAFSVQGVNSYYYVGAEIEEVLCSSEFKERGGESYQRIALAFDADMYRKHQVLDAAMKAASSLAHKTGKDIYIMFWSPELGKGYDDMKFYCESKGMDYLKELRTLDWRVFGSYAAASEKEADERYLSLHPNSNLTKVRGEEEWSGYLYEALFVQRIAPLI